MEQIAFATERLIRDLDAELLKLQNTFNNEQN